MQILVLLTALLFQPSAQALDWSGMLNGYLDRLERLGGQRSLDNASSWQGSRPEEYRACADTYGRMLEDGELTINFVFGYYDERDPRRGRIVTHDAEVMAHTKAVLQQRCRYSRENVCGFREVSRSSTRSVLEKRIKKTINGRTVSAKIKINFTRSSASEDDARNIDRSGPSSRQAAVTRIAEDSFFGGISGKTGAGGRAEKCDVCVYFGHARDGGGPDFGPVPLNWRERDGTPDYSYFHRTRYNYSHLLRSLEEAGDNPPSLVALFGCISKAHFWDYRVCPNRGDSNCKKKSLRNFSSKTGYILTDRLSYPNNFGQVVGTFLDGILGFKCKSAIEANMSRARATRYEGGKNITEAYRLYGNFL